MHGITCYCPIGLLPHFYLYVRKIHCSDNFCVNALSGCYLISTMKKASHMMPETACQCPLGLLPHFYAEAALSKLASMYVCQCPLGLLPHFYIASSNG